AARPLARTAGNGHSTAAGTTSAASIAGTPALTSTTHKSAAKTTRVTGDATTPVSHLELREQQVSSNFNLSYAEVAPAIGVQVARKVSVAAGADFQQALADNRPVVAAGQSFENVSVMPLFDIGLVGKTEYSVTKRVKAQVSYRKGINNILTPMDKFTDRDYLQ